MPNCKKQQQRQRDNTPVQLLKDKKLTMGKACTFTVFFPQDYVRKKVVESRVGRGWEAGQVRG
jgi:hypothetical protein